MSLKIKGNIVFNGGQGQRPLSPNEQPIDRNQLHICDPILLKNPPQKFSYVSDLYNPFTTKPLQTGYTKLESDEKISACAGSMSTELTPLQQGIQFSYAVEQQFRERMAAWINPGKVDSISRNLCDILLALRAVRHGIACWLLSCLCPCLCCSPRGDETVPVDGLEILRSGTEEQKRRLAQLFRLTVNQYLLISAEWGKRRGLHQPSGTENFLAGGRDLGEGKSELQLRLPDGLRNAGGPSAGGGRTAWETKLAVLGQLLRDRVFVAYGNGLLILQPEIHTACGVIFDTDLNKIVVHIRDTASDSFWEPGTVANWGADIRQGAGLVPKVYAETDFLVYGLVEIFGRENVWVTGHSMGGGIALFCGGRNLCFAVGLNPALLSPHNARFFPAGWGRHAAEGNFWVVRCDNDVVSAVLDNPETGGLLPSQYLAGTRDLSLAPAPGTGAVKAHYLSSLIDANARLYEKAHLPLPDSVKDTVALISSTGRPTSPVAVPTDQDDSVMVLGEVNDALPQ
jgi:hypothetical protein